MRFDQRASNLNGALERALDKMAGTTVAAVVLLSDGIQHGPGAAQPPPLPVAVFTVGVGPEEPWRDLELSGLSAARTNFDGTPVALTAQIRATGLAGEQARLTISRAGRPTASQTLDLGESAQYSASIEFFPEAEGWLEYRADLELVGAQNKDLVKANNSRAFAVDNRSRTYRILYLGGRPNWEHKFIRRALEADPQLAFSSLVRVSGAERKFVFRGRGAGLANPLFAGFENGANAPRYDEAVFLRLGLDSDQMAAGYPLEAAELFPFHLVIWGDIERAFFSGPHLQLTRDFVARRGGAFLMGGGPRALAAGGYAGTPIEAVLPVGLGPAKNVDWTRPFHPTPTFDGLLTGIFSLDGQPAKNKALWAELPPLRGLNPLPLTRTAATVLARVPAADNQPFFAWQRYGEGTGAVLATGATWPWQLTAPQNNGAHQRFWRQLVRALVRDVPEPVALLSDRSDVFATDRTQVEFLVRDSLFVPAQGATIELNASRPDGGPQALPVEESLQQEGLYTARFEPGQPGLYQLHLTARNPAGARIATHEEGLLVHPDLGELQRPRYNRANLKALATQSGGAFLELDQLDRLPELIPLIPSQTQDLERLPLWHLPPFYALLALLFSAEWYLRRKAGHP